MAWASETALFEACQRTHTPLDCVYIDHVFAEQLAGYDVLFYPHAAIMTADRAAMLTWYVGDEYGLPTSSFFR